MSNEKPSCQVILFPLCDPRGALSEVLKDPPGSGTRLNALILAWRLELPENINLSAAANAMLAVATARPKNERSEQHCRLITELRSISESNAGHPRAEWQRLIKRGRAGGKSRQRKTRTGRVFTEADS